MFRFIKHDVFGSETALSISGSHSGADDDSRQVCRWARSPPDVSEAPNASISIAELSKKENYSPCNKIEKNEMGGASGTYGGRERCAQGFGGET